MQKGRLEMSSGACYFLDADCFWSLPMGKGRGNSLQDYKAEPNPILVTVKEKRGLCFVFWPGSRKTICSARKKAAISAPPRTPGLKDTALLPPQHGTKSAGERVSGHR